MSQWVRAGLAAGIRTTRYPAEIETAAGVSAGLPANAAEAAPGAADAVERCPSGALRLQDGRVAVDARRCIHAFRCVRQVQTPISWAPGYEWARIGDVADQLDVPFRRSIHIMVVDAGDCGACLNEVRQLNNPYYNMHRLGFFVTPTPRHADLLLVVGAGTDHMRTALLKTYEAMPEPRRVIAVGACALTGGVFGPGFVTDGGIAGTVPVHVEVPGQPPPPLAILHGLLVAVGRARAHDVKGDGGA